MSGAGGMLHCADIGGVTLYSSWVARILFQISCQIEKFRQQENRIGYRTTINTKIIIGINKKSIVINSLLHLNNNYCNNHRYLEKYLKLNFDCYSYIGLKDKKLISSC